MDNSNYLNEIKKLKELLDEKIITEEEYNTKKQELLFNSNKEKKEKYYRKRAKNKLYKCNKKFYLHSFMFKHNAYTLFFKSI